MTETWTCGKTFCVFADGETGADMTEWFLRALEAALEWSISTNVRAPPSSSLPRRQESD